MIDLPLPDPDVLARRREIANALARLVPDGVVADETTLTAFDGDALTAYRQIPLVCVLPRNADEVSAGESRFVAGDFDVSHHRRHKIKNAPRSTVTLPSPGVWQET